ncbi:MAG TPA: type II toxin-antitoxin system VapC family toxin [Caulobacteraceae bacterium]
MTLIIDASVALKWVLDEPGADAADALLGETLLAPALWLVEAASALQRRVLRGELSADEARARLEELRNAPVTALPVDDDLGAALALSAELKRPVQDCLYLAAAIRENCQVITADLRLHNALADAPGHEGRVRLLT